MMAESIMKTLTINDTTYRVVDETALRTEDIPATLPNPHKLVLVGGCEAEYDGSTEVTVEIPSYLSDFQDDYNHRLVTDEQIELWNAKVNEGTLGEMMDTIGTHATNVANAAETNANSYTDEQIALEKQRAENAEESLSERLNALADSDDTTLDQLSEIVTYIKNNKNLIDGVTTSKVSVSDIVNNLITDATDKPLSAAQGKILKALIDAIEIPTKTSELTNDSGYITDLSLAIGTNGNWYIGETDTGVKANGADGTSVTVASVNESTADGGSSVVTFSDGKTLTVKNGSKGDDGKTPVKGVDYFDGKDGVDGADGKDGYTPQKGIDYYTEADKTELINELSTVCVAKNQGASNVGKILVVGTDGNLTLTDMPEGGLSGDVVGVLDESNNILLSGNLADGTYTLKYENTDGTYTEIGDLVVSTITNYAIYTNLENCLSSGATTIRGSGSATVTITPNKGYALPDSITVSGAGYSWNKANGQIVLSNPTSDVQISVIAVKSITNFIEPNTDNKSDWSIWCNDARVGSDGAYRASTTQDATNYIPVQNGDIIHINQGRIINSQIIGFYNSSKAKVTAGATTDLTNNGHIADATALSSTTLDAQFTITNASVAYIRFTLLRSSFSVGDDEIIVNIERNGEYL